MYIKYIINDDLKRTFIGVFPLNFGCKLIKDENALYPFIILSTVRSDKKEHVGGVFWIFICKNNIFSFIVLVLKASKHLLFKMIRRLLITCYLELMASKRRQCY